MFLKHSDNGVGKRWNRTPTKERKSLQEIQYEKLYGSVTHAPLGKNEFHDKLSIMEAVYSETGEVAIVDGMSTMDQARHYRTEPALKLLHQKTWKDFFEKMKNDKKNEDPYENNNNQSSSIKNRNRPVSAGARNGYKNDPT